MNNSRTKVALICDTSGQDDEGMKKVARNLAAVIGEMEGFDVAMISSSQGLSHASDFDVYHFVGGPTIRTVLVAFYCRCVNRGLKTILTFTNPFLGKVSLYLMSILKPTLCIVSSKKWYDILDTRGIRVRTLNVSGVDTGKFKPVSLEEKRSLRERLEWPDDKIMVLHVGHLKEDRNIGQLLDLQNDRRMQVVIVGSTTTKQSKAQVEMLESAGCITVTQYIVNIEEYYQAADCYVFPTVNERAAIQIPLSVLEALAVSLPIVTTDFGGLRDTFDNFGGAFRYIKETDFGSLAEIIMRHIDRKPENDIPLNSVDWKEISSNLVRIYDE